MFDKFIIICRTKLKCKQKRNKFNTLSLQVVEMIEIMQGLPENVIGIIYSETVTGKDYDDVLIPIFKEN